MNTNIFGVMVPRTTFICEKQNNYEPNSIISLNTKFSTEKNLVANLNGTQIED